MVINGNLAKMTLVNKFLNWTIRASTSSILCPIYVFKRMAFSEKSIPILYYHRVSPHAVESVNPEFFEQQIRWLKKENYRFISLKEYFSEKDENYFWKQNNVLLTFDEGYEDNYLYAYPVLKRYKATCTIFLATYYVDNECIMPWHEFQPSANEYFRMLSWDQIKEMSEFGIEFGSHTVNHPDLTSLDDAELREELWKSRKTIKTHIGKSVNFLCYPFGWYSKRVIDVAKEVGYKGACSSIYGLNRRDVPSFELRRIYIGTKIQTLFDFYKRVIGAYDIPIYIYQKLFTREIPRLE